MNHVSYHRCMLSMTVCRQWNTKSSKLQSADPEVRNREVPRTILQQYKEPRHGPARRPAHFKIVGSKRLLWGSNLGRCSKVLWICNDLQKSAKSACAALSKNSFAFEKSFLAADDSA